MNEMKKSFKKKAGLRCMADGGPIYESSQFNPDGSVTRSFSDASYKKPGMGVYTPQAGAPQITTGGPLRAQPSAAQTAAMQPTAPVAPQVSPSLAAGIKPASLPERTPLQSPSPFSIAQPQLTAQGPAPIPSRDVALPSFNGSIGMGGYLQQTGGFGPTVSQPAQRRPRAPGTVGQPFAGIRRTMPSAPPEDIGMGYLAATGGAGFADGGEVRPLPRAITNPLGYPDPASFPPTPHREYPALRQAAPTPQAPLVDQRFGLRKPMKAKFKAHGGKIEGPGGPTEDKIPAMLSDGEYVLPADTVDAVGVENLDALRAATHTPVKGEKQKRGLRKFAGGGMPDDDAKKRQALQLAGTAYQDMSGYSPRPTFFPRGGGVSHPTIPMRPEIPKLDRLTRGSFEDPVGRVVPPGGVKTRPYTRPAPVDLTVRAEPQEPAWRPFAGFDAGKLNAQVQQLSGRLRGAADGLGLTSESPAAPTAAQPPAVQPPAVQPPATDPAAAPAGPRMDVVGLGDQDAARQGVMDRTPEWGPRSNGLRRGGGFDSVAWNARADASINSRKINERFDAIARGLQRDWSGKSAAKLARTLGNLEQQRLAALDGVQRNALIAAGQAGDERMATAQNQSAQEIAAMQLAAAGLRGRNGAQLDPRKDPGRIADKDLQDLAGVYAAGDAKKQSRMLQLLNRNPWLYTDPATGQPLSQSESLTLAGNMMQFLDDNGIPDDAFGGFFDIDPNNPQLGTEETGPMDRFNGLPGQNKGFWEGSLDVLTGLNPFSGGSDNRFGIRTPTGQVKEYYNPSNVELLRQLQTRQRQWNERGNK